MGRTSHRYSEDAQRRSRAFRGRWHRTQSTRGKKQLGKPNLSPLPNLPFQRRLRHPQAQGPVPPIPAGSRLPRHRQRAGDSPDAAGGNACCQTRVRV